MHNSCQPCVHTALVAESPPPQPEDHMRELRRCSCVGRARITRTPSRGQATTVPTPCLTWQVIVPMPTRTYLRGACLFCQMGWESASDGAPCPPRSQPRIPPVPHPHAHQPTFTCPYPHCDSASGHSRWLAESVESVGDVFYYGVTAVFEYWAVEEDMNFVAQYLLIAVIA